MLLSHLKPLLWRLVPNPNIVSCLSQDDAVEWPWQDSCVTHTHNGHDETTQWSFAFFERFSQSILKWQQKLHHLSQHLITCNPLLNLLTVQIKKVFRFCHGNKVSEDKVSGSFLQLNDRSQKPLIGWEIWRKTRRDIVNAPAQKFSFVQKFSRWRTATVSISTD